MVGFKYGTAHEQVHNMQRFTRVHSLILQDAQGFVCILYVNEEMKYNLRALRLLHTSEETKCVIPHGTYTCS